MGNFHKIVILIGTVVILFSFLIALQIRKSKKTPNYLQQFYLYPLLILFLSINTLTIDFFEIGFRSMQATVEEIIMIIEFIFFAYFFRVVLNIFPQKKWIDYVFILFMFLTLPCVVLTLRQPLFHYYFRAFHNIGILLFCLIYIYSIFNNSPELFLKNNAAFWIVMGLLFYSSVTIPIFLGYYYLATNKHVSVLSILFPLTNISIIIMHLLFIKGYLCTIQQPKT